MKKIPIQVLLGRGELARVITIQLSVAEIRKLRRDAAAAGVSLRDWISGRLRQSIDRLGETEPPAAAPARRSGLAFPFLPEQAPRR